MTVDKKRKSRSRKHQGKQTAWTLTAADVQYLVQQGADVDAEPCFLPLLLLFGLWGGAKAAGGWRGGLGRGGAYGASPGWGGMFGGPGGFAGRGPGAMMGPGGQNPSGMYGTPGWGGMYGGGGPAGSRWPFMF